jgi:hypothetical protein
MHSGDIIKGLKAKSVSLDMQMWNCRLLKDEEQKRKDKRNARLQRDRGIIPAAKSSSLIDE